MITVDEFKNKLRDEAISDIEIVQGYITHGSAFVFKDDDDKYFKLIVFSLQYTPNNL